MSGHRNWKDVKKAAGLPEKSSWKLDWWEELRTAIAYDNNIDNSDQGLSMTAHVARKMLELHDKGELEDPVAYERAYEQGLVDGVEKGLTQPGSAWMVNREAIKAEIKAEALAPIRDYLEGTFTWLHGYKPEDAILKMVHDLRALLDDGDQS